MATKRVDAIGQEIKIGDIVKPFAKSGYSTQLSVVTRFNPVMIQVNGRDNHDADRLVVVTDNLKAMGKHQVVDDLQNAYAASMVHVNPDTPEPKVPVRYMVLANLNNPSDPKAWVIRFEGTNVTTIRDVLHKSKNTLKPAPTHVLRKDYKEELSWQSAHSWDVFGMSHARRTLPDLIAQLTNGQDDIVEIPQGDFAALGIKKR